MLVIVRVVAVRILRRLLVSHPFVSRGLAAGRLLRRWRRRASRRRVTLGRDETMVVSVGPSARKAP